MEYEDTISLLGISHYYNPTETAEVSKTYPGYTTVRELLEGMKEIALGLGYQVGSWNEAILDMADEIQASDHKSLDDIMDQINALDRDAELERFRNEPYPCNCDCNHLASRA
jgi:hypothetical protein